jgi:hypothetical protein
MLFRRLASALLLRRVSRDLTDISAALRAHTVLLQRLADRYAPLDPPTDRTEVKADTGVSHFDPIDAGIAQDYIDRTYRDTGHVPDEDEILIHLADEKTHDLHQRLVAREGELARLREDRW